MTRHAKKHPFWQADKPYLHSGEISDFRFRLLGYMMAALAGAINAGGFFAVNQYTSHVSGALSHSADQIYAGQWKMAMTGLAGVVAFILGAAHANWLILWAKRQRFRSRLWYDGMVAGRLAYLMVFGLMGVGIVARLGVVAPHGVAVVFYYGHAQHGADGAIGQRDSFHAHDGDGNRLGD